MIVSSEFKSFFKTVDGNEGNKCRYNTRLDVYGCGCSHDCSYCYAKSLLEFRGLWNPKNPSVADIKKIEKKLAKTPKGTILRLGGMTDCFQNIENQEKLTYQTIKLLNKYDIEYLLVTKSNMVGNNEYMEILDKKLAHIQISITTLDDKLASTYEKASLPSKRIDTILKLQDNGFDVSIRLSPIIDEYMDYQTLNNLGIDKCIVEFLRVNSWIKKWFPGIDYTNYKHRQSNYYHLSLEEKIKIIEKIKIPEKSICEDVTEHFLYWKEHINPNKIDCCNLRKG